MKIEEIDDVKDIEEEFRGRRKNSWDGVFEQFEASKNGIVVDGLTRSQIWSLYRAAKERGVTVRARYPKEKNGVGKVALLKGE